MVIPIVVPKNETELKVEEKIEEKAENKETIKKETVVKTSNKLIPQMPSKKIVKKANFVERYDRPCRGGFNLYTIKANVKIGDKKFNIQKIVEERTEKLADILFEKVIKNELGKPNN